MSRRIELASRWMYRGIWSGIVRWFRVPDEPPTLPVRPGEFVTQFSPAEGYLRYLKCIFWIVLLITDIALTGGYIAIAVALSMDGLWWVAMLLLPVALALIVLPDIIAYIALHLRYDTMWYVMTDRSLRIRRGIWSIRETTITFENVQNLKVQQGPLQRYFGIANLQVETAGAGASQGQKGGGGINNQAVIEGIANAEEIRDRILARMRQSKGAGLGDDAVVAHVQGVDSKWSPAHLAVLREIHVEIKNLVSA